MRTTLVGRWLEKNNKPFVALLAAGAALAIPTLIDASSSTQVQQLGPLAVPRTEHAATVLADGRVLITGGRDSAGTIVAAAEIFDPATQTSTAVGALVTARVSHTATLLPNGRVLITGGTSATGSLSSAEIFDPANPGFRVLSATMGAARAGHTATLLTDGTVLIAGGDVAGSAEIFEPTTESFSSTLLTMAAPRIGHTATLFANDSVLLAGGNTDSMELFTPADQKFTLDSQVMSAVHTGQEAISLSDTRLLFFGGDALNTIEEFNPSADTLTIDATMEAPSSSATLLSNGNILVVRADMAGLYAPNAADLSSAFTAFDETSVPGSSMLLRTGQTATELPGDKTILVAGGANAQSQLSQSTALFNPARIWTDKDDYVPTDPVILSGSGWKPNENVYLYAVDDETQAWTYGSTVAADANGAFSVNPYFIVQMAQLGAKFSVTAVGAQSALQADVKFTDAGSFTYSPSTQSLTIAAGSNATFSQGITDPKNNGALTASPVVTGTGGNPLPASWVTTSPTSLSFPASSSDQTQSWMVKVTVPANVAGTYTGNIKASASGSGATPNPGQGTGMTITVPAGPATQLALSGSTANLAAGSTRVLTATIQDANGNTVTTGADSTLSVTFAKTAGTGTVTGLGSSTAVAGVATLTVTGGQPGSVTITASATGSGGALAAGTGNPVAFNVVAGAASKLALSGATTDLAAGSTRVLTATIQDANGNTVTTGADSTLSVTFAKTAGTGTVTGLGSATASAGVATLTVTGNAPGSITITASATGSGGALTAGTGNPITFNVVAGAAGKLAISGSTANLTAGTTRTLTATIQDSVGNTITTGPDSTLSVTFAKTTGTGDVSGLTSVSAVAGVANITVTGTTAGSVTIGASATGSGGALGQGTGNPISFTVVASTTVDHFSFAAISSPQTAGTAFNVTITAQDAGNNTVTGFNGNGFKVNLTSTGTLTGAPLTTPAFTNGVLTNQSVTITNIGNFTIMAQGVGGNSGATGTSNSFQVNPGAASKLAFTQQPSTTTAGQTISPSVAVQIQDANGNLTNSTASVSIAIANNPSSGSLSGTTPVNAANGVATFSDLSINKGGTGYTLQASSNGLTSATSGGFNITPAGASKLVFGVQPSNATAGATISPAVTVQVQDQFGNLTTSTAAVGIAILANPGGGTLSGTSPVNAVAGVATFSNLAINKTGAGYTLQATSSGLTSVTSSTFNITPAPASKLAFAVQPSNTTAGQTISPAVTVQVQDQFGNLTGSTASVGIAILANPGTGTLTATTPVNALGGTATFSDLSIDKGGVGYTLQASSTGLTSVTSAAFTINNPAPTLASIAPTSGNLSDTLDVVFNGTNYISGASLVSFGPNITVNTTTVNSSTKITANITIASGAVVGPRNVSVTNPAPGGGTATLTNGFTVNNPATTTTLDSSLNPSTYGDSVTFTATVTSASGTPTGSVTFFDSATCSGTVLAGPTTLDVNGKAGFTTSSLTVPSHTITACYSPTGIYLASNGSVTQTVNKRPATWTTDANSKTYGVGDPVPLTTGSGTGFLFSDSVTASYSRAAGETVAGSPYHISATLSPAAVLSNYNITNTGADFTIAKKDATWTTNAASKTYGDVDPNPLTTGSGSGFLAADSVTATYTRAAGENASPPTYHITATLAPAAVLSNYNITNTGADFTINKRDASVTPDAASKIYGNADPTFTGTLTGFVAADGVSATYSRTAGETVAGSPYTISAVLSPAGVLGNYNITYNTASFTINKRDASVTPDAASKIYGNADPTFTGTLTGFVAADGVGATYSRTAGETVAGSPYTISAVLSPAGVLGNYNITYNTASFTINKRDATWTTNANSKTYGDADPNPLTTGSGDFLAADGVTATYSRAAGETVGSSPYHITATLAPAAVLSNYNITNAGANFTINKRPATWTTDPNSKTYGDLDPSPLTTGSGSNFVDAVTASYSRVAGETVGGNPYHITATLSAGAGVLSNYTITNTGADFTINKRDATWTTNPNSKTYGDLDPSPLTTGSGTNFVAADSVTATYSRVAGANAGPPTYHITATLSATPAAALNNYNITNAGAEFTINKAVAVVTVSGYTGTYDGHSHGASGSATGVDAGGAALGATLDLGATFTNVPGGTAHWVFTGGTNYTNQSGDVAVVINKVHLTVTADNKSKTYNGAVYSPFTATLSGFVNSETDAGLRLSGALSGNAVFTGVATTAVNAGTYTITPTGGTLSAINYDFTVFTNGKLTITKAHLTVTADPKTVQYSDRLPSFTATLSGFVNSETDASLRLSGDLSGNASFTTAAAITFYSGTGGVSNAPGAYTNAIIPSVGTLVATNYDFPAANFVKGTLTVTQEDARATYTGAMFASTSSTTSTTATVTLSATVQDITAVGNTDPAYDPYPGDIRNAKVTFVNRDAPDNTNPYGFKIIASDLPVGLVNLSDTTVGTVTYNWNNVSIGTYTVGIIVTNYYTRNSSSDDGVIQVSQLTPGSINGGGYLVMQSSAGLYPGGVGTKNNFGFNVQNTKTGLKGNINTIIRNNGRVYQIKGNAMTSLNTQLNTPTTGTSLATFNGKANIQDITDPLAPISIDGNATLQVTMTDYGQPTKDTIAITVWNKSGGMWFSSNWTGTKTQEQTLGGGNLAVR